MIWNASYVAYHPLNIVYIAFLESGRYRYIFFAMWKEQVLHRLFHSYVYTSWRAYPCIHLSKNAYVWVGIYPWEKDEQQNEENSVHTIIQEILSENVKYTWYQRNEPNQNETSVHRSANYSQALHVVFLNSVWVMVFVCLEISYATFGEIYSKKHAWLEREDSHRPIEVRPCWIKKIFFFSLFE